jgi:hypothetical protein
MIDEWDYLHGQVEKYNARGRHLGDYEWPAARRPGPWQERGTVKTKVVYDLVGYDRETERMAEQHAVPPSLVRTVKQIAGIGDRSDDQPGACALTEGQARNHKTTMAK